MAKKIKTFDDFMNDSRYVTKNDKREIDFQVDLISKLIEVREKKGYTQRELATICNVKQPEIARIESLKCSPQVDTLFRLLAPLGYTLSIKAVK